MMYPAIKTRWVEALRSGEYLQGRRALRVDGKSCCLGVLCDLAVKSGLDIKVVVGGGDAHSYDGQMFLLPTRVRFWAGLDAISPRVMKDGGVVSLSNLNDNGATFAEIADLIEEQL